MALDGEWYSRIAAEGYTYDTSKPSTVAFFPGFPIFGRIVARVTGLPTEYALIIAANLSFLVAITLLYTYTRYAADHNSVHAPLLSVLAFCVFPTSFYFRLAYAESLFVLFLILMMMGIQRQWSLLAISFLAGCVTGIRPVGIAALLPVANVIWNRSNGYKAIAWRSIVLLPLSCWGLLAYGAYLQTRFGNALAFAQTQIHWSQRPLPDSWIEYAIGLGTLAVR